MLKKFFEGLIFGSGFAVSFFAILFFAVYFSVPNFSDSGFRGPVSITTSRQAVKDFGPSFDELTIDEKIEASSVIALAKYELAQDGRIKAVFTEFLKKAPDVIFHYQMGDEYSEASYYPEKNVDYGDGIVLFFAGSPASMRMLMPYSGGRIRSLGNMPIKLFREKCKKDVLSS